MKNYICDLCHKTYTPDDLGDLLPICECGEDLREEPTNEDEQ
jgi:hypothetical protein